MIKTILKVIIGKQLIKYEENPIILSAEFLAATLQAIGSDKTFLKC